MNNTYPELVREIEAIIWGTESDIAKVHAIQGLLYSWDQVQDNKTQRLFDWDNQEGVPVTFKQATLEDIEYSSDYTPGLDHSVLK